jgi:molybdopterin/thiamine biosynthesis adenylyltransferase
MVADTLQLTEFELERYERQVRMDGFGIAAQKRLKQSSVLVSRVGGVGGAAAVRLAQAGVGRLILAHGGKVVADYLNRWPVGLPTDIGRPCVAAVGEQIHAMKPAVELVLVESNVTDDNVRELVGQADLVVDGAPLFEERYLMNREAVEQGKPLVAGAMYSTEGFVTTISSPETPCLACIFPTRPEYWSNIKVFPAIGPGPAIVGAMAGMEAIKVLTGFGTPLKNVLWFFDLETNVNRSLRIRRRADCPVCRNVRPAHAYA